MSKRGPVQKVIQTHGVHKLWWAIIRCLWQSLFIYSHYLYFVDRKYAEEFFLIYVQNSSWVAKKRVGFIKLLLQPTGKILFFFLLFLFQQFCLISLIMLISFYFSLSFIPQVRNKSFHSFTRSFKRQPHDPGSSTVSSRSDGLCSDRQCCQSPF